MAMQRASFPRSLEAGLNAVWMASELDYPSEYPQIFEMKTASKAVEEQVLRGGFGAAPIKPEGAAISEDEGIEGWSQRYVMITVALKFALTQEALEDNLYKDLGAQYTKELLRAMMETEEILAANVLNNSVTTNLGDGVPLLSTAHPLLFGGTTSNKLATPADFSESSLEDLLIQIRDCVNNRNLPCPINPKKLIVGNANYFQAIRILRSVQRVGTPDNDINAVRAVGLFGNDPVTLRRLTDTDAWYIQTDASMGLQFFTRQALQKGGQEDFNTGNWEYKARKRFACGVSNWRALYGSEGN